jgi:hypothetical protein
MKRFILSTILLLIFSAVMQDACAQTENNFVKIGSANVAIHIDYDSISSDEPSVEVFGFPLLDNIIAGRVNYPEHPVKFTKRDAGTWVADVPMELLWKNNVLLRINTHNGNRHATLGIGLDQRSPLSIDVTLAKDGSVESGTSRGGTGDVDWQGNYLNIYENLFYRHNWNTPKEAFTDCMLYRQYRLEQMQQSIAAMLDEVKINECQRAWAINEMKRRWYSAYLMEFEAFARRDGGDSITVKAPPMEYYSFLVDLDYSPLILDEMIPDLRELTNKILRLLPTELQSIGETPIADWQKNVAGELSRAIPNPPQMLLDLLTATSYLRQIQTEREPLSELQQLNISNFYEDNDLGKVILARNIDPYPANLIIEYN